MKFIDKSIQDEPSSLTRHKNTPNHNYKNYSKKNDLRQNLLKGQGYLCCYCMRRIQTPTVNKMKIEHFMPYSIYNGENEKPDLTLDYNNLIASCKGGEGGSKRLYHCDKSKESIEIILNPTDRNLMAKIKFTRNGIILTANRTYDNEIDNILNLNIQSLKDGRKMIWESLEQIIKNKFGNRTVTKSFINKKIKYWKQKDALGMSKEYCQVAIYYLTKKIKKAI